MMAEDNTERYPVKEEEYETLYQIGNGSTAKVFTMLIKATKAHVAVKVSCHAQIEMRHDFLPMYLCWEENRP
eukprot:m.76020 g.76020  ORF g.76020 m.76020 type:complete len:72 (-) comp14419_c0_seq1:7-222(-)